MVIPSENKIIIYIEGIGKIHIPENFGYIDQDIKEEFLKHISSLIISQFESTNMDIMFFKNIINNTIKKYELTENYEICDILKKTQYIFDKKYERKLKKVYRDKL